MTATVQAVSGAGRMPGFASLGREAVQALTHYLVMGEDIKVLSRPSQPSPIDLRYAHHGYNRFLDPDGYPAVKPPWGTLNAINLNQGEIAYSIPLGERERACSQ